MTLDALGQFMSNYGALALMAIVFPWMAWKMANRVLDKGVPWAEQLVSSAVSLIESLKHTTEVNAKANSEGSAERRLILDRLNGVEQTLREFRETILRDRDTHRG